MLTFLDGPRMCLGRNIAVAGMKVSKIVIDVEQHCFIFIEQTLLAVLIRNFTFKMRDGPDTKVETVMNMFPRPKIAGEEGYAMPLLVKIFDD